MADSLDFKKGYLMACTTFANLHAEPSMAREILEQVNITEKDVAAMELTEWDAEGLADMRAEPGPDPIRPST